VIDYNQVAASAVKRTVNLAGVAATDVDAISKINVATYPQSDHILITANDKIFVYTYPGGAVGTDPVPIAGPDATTGTVTSLGTIRHLITGFHFADAYIANNLQVLSVKMTDDTPGTPTRCHENCRNANTPTA
jgi:hypothetical protein